MSSAEGYHHVTPFKTYMVIYFSLLALTVITVLTAKFVDLGVFNMLLAMGIATAKGLLVVLWFMHQKYENNVNRVVFASAFFFLFLMFGICAADIFTRGNFTNAFGM